MLNILVPSAAHSLTDYFSASEGQIAYNIMKHLASYGCFFYAIGSNIMIREPLENAKLYNIRLPSDGLRLKSLVVMHLTGLYYAWRSYQAARKLLRKEKFDLVHHIFPSSSGVSFSLLPLLSHVSGHCPFIFGPICSSSQSARIRESIASKLHYATVRKSCALIVETPLLKAEYSKVFDTGKIWVIPLGVDTDRFSPSQVEHGEEKLEILTVANLTKRKGIDYLIKAMPQILLEHKDIKLNVVGDGPEKENLIRLTRALGVEENVIFQGSISNLELPEFYQKADIFCLPSLMEAFGKVIIEAMASGKPIIATKVEGPPQIVDHMEDGIIVPPAHCEALAQAIVALASDKNLRERMGKKGREKVVARYSLSRMVEQYYEVYRAVLGSRIR